MPADENTTTDDQEQEHTGPAEGHGQEQDLEKDPDGADQLGDAGKRALDAMKARYKAEREARRKAEAERDAAQVTDEETRKARELEQAALATANRRILRAEIRAAAKGQLADPTDALTFLDLDRFEVDADGAVDAEEIADAIGGLIKSKPYLGAPAARVPRFADTGDGGARTGQSPKSQLTRDELAKLSPAARMAAFEEGRCKNLTG
ncbi:hypothetical protein [Streptomyces celluloflavus]|uniref:hypothetical protein n=1 Tax=Streptomyces celluloflavus TaxID=58344 RepID=UPI0036C874FB